MVHRPNNSQTETCRQTAAAVRVTDYRATTGNRRLLQAAVAVKKHMEAAFRGVEA